MTPAFNPVRTFPLVTMTSGKMTTKTEISLAQFFQILWRVKIQLIALY